MKKEMFFGLAVALFLAILLSPFASPRPDGLEKVSEDKNFIEKAEAEPTIHAPVPDYGWPGVKNEKIAASLAGLAGTLVVFFLGTGIAFILRKKTRHIDY